MAFIVKKQANLNLKNNTTFKIPRTPFLPSSLGGLSLWLKADAGTTTEAEQFISQIVISGAGTTTSNGTYTRASGGGTNFSGPNGNAILFDSVNGGSFLFQIYDDSFEGITYNILINYTTIISISIANGSPQEPTASTSLTTTGNTLVTAWADQSGNDNNFNGTAEFLTNTLNGKPVINFNGIDTVLTGPAGLLSGFSALSFIAVWNVESAQSNKGIFGSSNYGNLEVIANGDVIVRIRNNNYSATFINGAGLTNLDEFALSYFDASNLTGSVFKNAIEATVAYISEIILTDAGTNSSNGTYTRASSGTASFSGPDGNEIYWDGTWYLYDASLEDTSYYNEEFDFSSGWQLNYGDADAPTAAYTTTTGSIGNQSAVQMPLATNITYELGRYAYPDYLTLYASFQLAELIIYNSKLTTPQRQQVEAYLNSKYQIY